MGTRRLGGLALSAAAAFLTIISGRANGQLVTGGGAVTDIPGANFTGAAAYNAGTLLWTYTYTITNLPAGNFYHLYITQDPTHRGVNSDEANFIGPVQGGAWGIGGGPGLIPDFNPALPLYYYHGGTFAPPVGVNVYTMSFTDVHGPTLQTWAISRGGLSNYTLEGGPRAVPVPRVPAPASAALIASGLIALRRRRR